VEEMSERQKSLVFKHATIINTADGTNETDTTVIIANDRITGIDKTGKLQLPEEAQVVDAKGKFLIPGLWDMHAHRGDIRQIPLFIANGVTGVRIMWGYPTHYAWRDEISRGSLLGPRLIIASPIIDGPKPFWPGSIGVGNEVEARRAVRQAKENGADFIKIYELLSREAFCAIADESKKLRIPFAGHIPWSVSATEASDAGQKCIEHLGSAVSWGVLLDCSDKEEELRKEGAKAFEDISLQRPLTPSQIETQRSFPKKVLATYDSEKAAALFSRFAKNNTWFCPTLTVLRSIGYLNDKNFTNDPRLKYMKKNTKENWDVKNNPLFSAWTEEEWAISRKIYQKELEVVGAMRRAGVEMLAGSDEPNPFCFPGFSLHDELGLLVQAGLTPMEALQAATYKAAEFFGMMDSLGTVEKGKIADLVLLEANPLEDISNTRKIAAVVVSGKYYPKTSLDEMLAKVEASVNLTPIAGLLLKTITEKDVSSALRQYHELKATKPDAYDFAESELNSLGYRLLGMKKNDEAIDVFKLNVEIYPQSYNVYDSLAEAYRAKGDRKRAIKNYAKSLELNRFNWGAAETLRKLKKA
jgi:hypothetical protein